MCSINHDLKCIFLHIPKTAGSYLREILEEFYGFKTYYFTAENHEDYIDSKYEDYNEIGSLYIKKKGIYRYFKNSKRFNLYTGMDEDKWKTYKKFAFVRNPYDRFLSSFNYLRLKQKGFDLLNVFKKKELLTGIEYFHIFMTQYQNLIDDDNKINIDFIGRYENLNGDIIDILHKIGVSKITHINYLKNNVIINSSTSTKKILLLNNGNESVLNDESVLKNELVLNNESILKNKRTNETEISENVVKLINEHFSDDLKYFNYKQIFSEYKTNPNKINTNIVNINKDILGNNFF